MKVILYMAASADGFIAKSDDNTDWVSDTDWGVFSKMVKDARCIVMGRRTYGVSGDDFPYDCELNIVMTKNKNLLKESKKVIFTDKNPKDLISLAKKRGFKKLLIIGGGKINTSFLKDKLIDEMYLSVHPKILGKGIKVFEGGEIDGNLTLLGVKQLKEDLVQLHYKVKK